MGVSHIALAVKDVAASHRFYTEAMGFELVKTEVMAKGGGFARHLFYSTGSAADQMMALWDLSNVPGHEQIRTDISRDLGFDEYTNHIAFTVEDLDGLEACKQRWLGLGHSVVEIDHGWVSSIYTSDPDGITVEFAVVTRPPGEADRAEALALLADPAPPLNAHKPLVEVFRPDPQPQPSEGD